MDSVAATAHFAGFPSVLWRQCVEYLGVEPDPGSSSIDSTYEINERIPSFTVNGLKRRRFVIQRLRTCIPWHLPHRAPPYFIQTPPWRTTGSAMVQKTYRLRSKERGSIRFCLNCGFSGKIYIINRTLWTCMHICMLTDNPCHRLIIFHVVITDFNILLL